MTGYEYWVAPCVPCSATGFIVTDCLTTTPRYERCRFCQGTGKVGVVPPK